MKDRLHADFSFWTGFYCDEDCFAWASNKAYLDMNRTLTFREIPGNKSQKETARIDALRKAWRDKGTDIIKAHSRFFAVEFTDWHKSVCRELIDHYGDDKLVEKKNNQRTEHPAKLTYGQAQKWLNMTLKYLWLLNRLHLIDDENTVAFIDTYEKSFHVPLDSYILRYVARQDKSSRNKFSPSNDNGLEPNTDFTKYWNQFSSAWSHIDDQDAYYQYQQKLKEAIPNGSPLEWELIHWHKALKYYG